MIGIISPAKSVNFNDPAPTEEYSTPIFLDETQKLADILKKYDTEGLISLMSISEKIAELNRKRFSEFNPPFSLENAKQAMFSFTGEVYRHMRMNTYDTARLQFAQRNLRILSGFYGYLRPLDLIQPYRLEMQTRLRTRKGQDLYKFWGNKITQALKTDLGNDPAPALINLASKEYSKAIQFESLEAPVISVNFKELTNGKARTIAIFAKWARGMMMDYIIQNELQDPNELKGFNEANYQFSAGDSNQKEWVFTRPKPE